jgi:Bacterial Ig domain
MRDNVMLRSGNLGGAFNTTSGSGCTNCTIDHNLFSTAANARGTSAIVGVPVFQGGAALTNFASYLLAPGSPGFKAASDGLDIGIYPMGLGNVPAPAPAPSRGSARSVGTAPKVALSRPAMGALFSSRLRVAARAKDDHGIDRVGFWIDGHWIGTDRKAPYAMTWRVRKGTRYRSHTVTARAFAVDGQASSVAVTVRRVHRHAARSSAAAASARWRLASSPSRGGTLLKGRGRPRHKVVATLARCDDAAAKTAARVTLRASSKGVVIARRGTANLCVLRLQPV